MITIRLSRVGKKNDPFYRVVALEARSKRDGGNLGVLGHWHPRTDLKKIDKKAIEALVAKGAQVSDAVKKLLS